MAVSCFNSRTRYGSVSYTHLVGRFPTLSEQSEKIGQAAGNKDRKGSKAAKITKPPNTVINTPDTRLMVINTRSRNFFRKMFTSVESVYHHKPCLLYTSSVRDNHNCLDRHNTTSIVQTIRLIKINIPFS